VQKKVSVGVIGCGFFAPNHLHAWAELPGVTLDSVCDLDLGKANDAAKRFGVTAAYSDASTMISDRRPDCIDIVTTMGAHRTLVELCAAAKIPVIVQKPFGPTFGDCLAMVEACEVAEIPLMVHENFRFQHPMREVKAVLDSGAIGDPVWARLSFRTHYDVKAGQPYLFKEERFIVLDLGIHVLDLARFFLGEVDTLVARHQRIDSRVRGEDMATIMLGHRSGATCVVDCTYESQQLPDNFPQTLVTIEGTKGAVELRRNFSLALAIDGKLAIRNVAAPLRSWTSEPWHVAQDSVYHTQKHFLDCLQNGTPPETSGRDNLRTYSLVDAAYASAAKQAVITL
jgi:predicted dehydrogenase